MMHPVTITREPDTVIAELTDISPAFTVSAVLDIAETSDGFRLTERPVSPYEKEYDAGHGEGPVAWPTRFDVSNWHIFGAWCNGERIGSAVLVMHDDDVDMLEGRDDVAVLWDIRVDPRFRGNAVASRLFAEAAEVAAANGMRWLKIETQNVNVPACRLYQRMGCILRRVCYEAYPTHPDETQMLWYREL